MKLRRFIFILLLVVLIVSVIFVINKFFSQGKISQQRHIALGVWTEGLFDPSTQKLHPEKLLQFEQLIHKKVSIAHYYRGWETLVDPNLIIQFDSLHSHGWTPMLNVNPYFFSQCPPSNLPLYKAIANGDCDKFLHKSGRNLRQVQQPFYLLFAWEMNNKDLEWSTKYSGSTPSDFVAAWRHMHTIFKQENAKNVVWVFCPNTQDSTSVSYDEVYPGNDFVDWIGLDGYNWGTSQAWSQWSSFAGTFTSSYKHLTTMAPNKPMMIAEVNTTDQGGDKSAWYTDMFTQQIPYNFPKIAAVVIFNEDRSKQEHINWKIDVNSDTLNAFILAIHTKFYQQIADKE